MLAKLSRRYRLRGLEVAEGAIPECTTTGVPRYVAGNDFDLPARELDPEGGDV
jgi:hypothetical protein